MAKSLDKDYDYMFKVILLGAGGVGKSKILERLLKNQFRDNAQPTIGVEFATKVIITTRGTRIKLQVWDTAGQERFRSTMRVYYKGATAAIIVYDITDPTSFERLESEQQDLQENIKSDSIVMIVGNKTDLESERKVSKQEGLKFAETNRIAFYEVSAKTGSNVDLIFMRLAEGRQAHEELEKAMESEKNPAVQPANKESTIKITPALPPPQRQKKKCCP